MPADGPADPDAAPRGGAQGLGSLDGEHVDDLRRRVVAAVRRNCPPWLAAQAEDIVQNVLLKLLKTSRKSEGEKRFSAVYLEKSVYGAVVDEIRRACRRKERPVEDEQVIEQITAPGESPERDARSFEIARAIQHCLLRLVRSRRLAVTLYLQGCTVPETALQLSWTAKKAENLVYRGLADLRTCLRHKGLEP
jgi:RNA polymerase sigma-70 factor (ECF subfamily)